MSPKNRLEKRVAKTSDDIEDLAGFLVSVVEAKDDFIKKYPKSITAQKAKGLRDHTEWDAYDMVLEYLYSTEQVSTLEEANYVMMEMEQQTIGEIVKEVTVALSE